MKKSIMPSLLTGGAAITLVAVLIVAMVFICLGDDVDTSTSRPQQGMPHIISPNEGQSEFLEPTFDFNDTKGYLEIKYDSSILFSTDASIHVKSRLRIKELYGCTVTVKSIRYLIYNGNECIHTSYVEPSSVLKSTVIGGASIMEFNHTAELFEGNVVGEISLVYVITWQDDDGKEGVSSCRRDYPQ